MEKKREDEIWCIAAGLVSSGKSKFLNAVFPGLGLPVGTIPMTAVPTFLRFGEAAVEIATNQGQTFREGLEDLAAYSRKRKGQGEKLCSLDVYLEDPVLKEGLVFIDMPGIGTAGEADDVFFELLPKAETVFYFLGKAMTGEDKEYLDAISSQKAKLIVVRTKIDQIHSSEETVEEVLREEQETILSRYPECSVFFVSLDQEMEESQLNQLKDYIGGLLRRESKEVRNIRQREASMEELAGKRRQILRHLKRAGEVSFEEGDRRQRRRLRQTTEQLHRAKATIMRAVDETKKRCQTEGLEGLTRRFPEGGWPEADELQVIKGEVSELYQWYWAYVQDVTEHNFLEEPFEGVPKLPKGPAVPFMGHRPDLSQSRQQYKRLVAECFLCVKDHMLGHFQRETRNVYGSLDREEQLIGRILDMDRQITRKKLEKELEAVEEKLMVLAQPGGDGR